MTPESELVGLINSDPGVLVALGGVLGGWPFGELPHNSPLPSWEYRMFGGSRTVTLAGVGSHAYGWRRLEISCIGMGASSAIDLASAIDDLLSGFSGPLGSPPTVMIDSIFPINLPMDFPPDVATRSWRRVLEYQVWFKPL